MTPEERLGIAHAVGIVASHEVEERTLTTLKVALPERVAAAVEPYTVAGSYGRLFDGEQTEDHQEARMRTIELGEILRMGDEGHRAALDGAIHGRWNGLWTERRR